MASAVLLVLLAIASLRNEGCFFSVVGLPKLASKQTDDGEETNCAAIAIARGFFGFCQKRLCIPSSEESPHSFCQKRVCILFCQKRLCILLSEESPHSFCLKRVCIPFCQKRLCISAFCSNDYSSEPVAEEAVVAVLAVGAEDDDLTAVVELRAEGHTLVIG